MISVSTWFQLGLNENQCKAAVGQLSCQAIRTAAGRKIGPFRATGISLDDLPPEERWKIPSEVKGSEDGSSESEASEDEDEMETD
jgi:hypothetical protein